MRLAARLRIQALAARSYPCPTFPCRWALPMGGRCRWELRNAAWHRACAAWNACSLAGVSLGNSFASHY